MSNFQKQAAPDKKLLGTVLSALAGGTGASLGMDAIMHPDEEFLGGEWDQARIANTALNAILGAGGGAAINAGKIYEGGALIGMAPAKDLMLSLQNTVHKGNEVLDATATKLKNPPTSATDSTSKINDTLKWVGGGALGLGGLALLAKLLKKDKPSSSDIPTQGTLKYKILGRKDDPNDDVEVELPIDTDKFTPDMHMQMDASIRRQAKKAIRNNMRKRDPETGKLITYDQYIKKYGQTKMATFIDGLTNKAVPSYKKEESETPSTTREFYRLRAGAAMNDKGTTVKSASREFSEGAGTALTGITGASLGALAGAKLTKDNPLLGLLAGGAVGGLAPILAGKTVAAIQEEDRSEEAQKEHDKGSATLEYLIPGYGAYQNSRRKSVKITGNSFANVGMNPIQTSYGTSLEDAVIADEEEPYDIIEKHANQAQAAPPPQDPNSAPPQDPNSAPPTAPPPVHPNTGAGSAPVRNQSQTAKRSFSGKMASMSGVINDMRDVLSSISAAPKQ